MFVPRAVGASLLPVRPLSGSEHPDTSPSRLIIPVDPAAASDDDLRLERAYPAVPWEDPSWDASLAYDEGDTWELGPAIPLDAVILPPGLEREAMHHG